MRTCRVLCDPFCDTAPLQLSTTRFIRLYNACQAKLMQQDGWKDQLEELARETVRETPEEVSLQDLVTKLVPVGKSSIPPKLHDELRTLVKESIERL